MRTAHVGLIAVALVLTLAASMATAVVAANPAGATSPPTSTISGTVRLAPASTPVAGMNVWLFASTNQLRATTTSLADGTFSFTGLTNGSYTVRVWDPTGALAGSWWGPSGVAQSQATASPITVMKPGGPDPSINLSVFPSTATISGTVMECSTGCVGSAIGAIGGVGISSPVSGPTAVAGATVSLVDAAYGTVRASTTTAGDGRWTLAGVPINQTAGVAYPGPGYKLSVAAPGFPTRWWTNAVGTKGAAPVLVDPVLPNTFDVSLSGTATVTGRVTNGAAPIAGVYVLAASGGDLPAFAITDGLGQFTLTVPADASYLFAVIDPAWVQDHATGYLPEFWGTRSSSITPSDGLYESPSLASGTTLAIGDDVIAGHSCDPAWQVQYHPASLPGSDLHGAALQGCFFATAFAAAGADLGGADLAGADLTGASLRMANLAGADLTGAILTGADLTGANLNNAIGLNTTIGLRSATFSGVDFSGTAVDLHGIDLSGRDLTGTNFKGANLSGANLSNTKLDAVRFDLASLFGANLNGANGNGVSFNLTSLRNATLKSAWLWNAAFFGTGWLHADLTGATVAGRYLNTGALLTATIAGTDLSNSYGLDFSHLDFAGHDVRGTNFGSANLSDTSFAGQNLTGVKAPGANLTGAHLAGANLAGANLDGSNLTSADLAAANLAGASAQHAMLTATSLTAADLTGANLDSATDINTAVGLLSTTFGHANLSHTGLDWHGVSLTGRSLAGTGLAGDNLSGADAHGVDLSASDLRGTNLTHTDLHGANLTTASLSTALLDAANLSGATLDQAVLGSQWVMGVTLGPASMVGTDFHLASMQGTQIGTGNVSGDDFKGAELTGAHLDRAIVNGADLTGATIDQATFAGVDLRTTPTVLAAIGFETARFPQANLSGLDLHGRTFTQPALSGAILRGTNLSNDAFSGPALGWETFGPGQVGTDLTGATITGATFTNIGLDQLIGLGTTIDQPTATFANIVSAVGTDLSGIDRPGLTIVNLTGGQYGGSAIYLKLNNANVPGADLHGSFIWFSSLQHANLAGANLSGAKFMSNFTGANLDHVNFTGATLVTTNFTNANLNGAILTGASLHNDVWSNTTCPDGTNSDAHGATCIGHL